MKSSLFCISLFVTTIVLPMDLPPNRQTKKTKKQSRSELIFNKEYAIGSNHMDCIAFLDDCNLMVGEPSRSMIMDIIANKITYFDLPANHLVSYPEQKLIVVTSCKGVGIYQVDLRDEKKITEKDAKKNTTKNIFSGKSFLICEGRKLVTVKNKKLKVYSYKKGVIGKSLPSKIDEDIKLYGAPDSLSAPLFFCQTSDSKHNNAIKVIEINNKKVSSMTIFDCSNDVNHEVKQCIVSPTIKTIAFLTTTWCQVFKGECFNRPIRAIQPVCVIPHFNHYQFSVAFYADSIVACLIFSDNPLMPCYRKLKIAFHDINTRKIIFSKIIKKVSRGGFWHSENPDGLWTNPSEIAFSPDCSKYAVLWSNSVFVYTVPLRLWKKTPQFSKALNRMFMVPLLPLPSELLSLIKRFLFLSYK